MKAIPGDEETRAAALVNNARIFIGLDLSLNHWGMVGMSRGGTVEFVAFISERKRPVTVLTQIRRRKGFAFPITTIGHYPNKPKGMASEQFIAVRRRDMLGLVQAAQARAQVTARTGRVLWQDDSERVLAIEGYAYNARSRSTYQIGELGGMVRNLFYESGAVIKEYDPQTVKMWGTGRGNAIKKDMRGAAVGRFVLPDYLFEEKKEDLIGPGTDLVDAFFLADMARQEFLYRSGERSFDSLSEHQRRAFNRVTKSNPVPPVARPLVHRSDGWKGEKDE